MYIYIVVFELEIVILSYSENIYYYITYSIKPFMKEIRCISKTKYVIQRRPFLNEWYPGPKL